MTVPPAVRVQALPDTLEPVDSPHWWAMGLFLLVELVVYGTLATAYVYLRFHLPQWPPLGTAPPDPLWGAVGSLALLASSGLVILGGRALGRAQPRVATRAYGMAGGLALAFPFAAGADLYLGGFRWDEHVYGSLVWTIYLVQALHAVAIAAAGLLIARLVARGELHAQRRLGADVLAFFWHFAVLIWLPMLPLLHLLARAS